jgi:hypothetical protein
VLLNTHHVIEVLNGLARRAFAEIVQARHEDQTATRLIQREADIAKICVRDML